MITTWLDGISAEDFLEAARNPGTNPMGDALMELTERYLDTIETIAFIVDDCDAGTATREEIVEAMRQGGYF